MVQRVKPAGAKSKSSIPPWEAALMDTSKKGKGAKKTSAASTKAAPAPAPATQESKPEIVTVQDMEVSIPCRLWKGTVFWGLAAGLTAQRLCVTHAHSSQRT
jgi:hypothetical protein